MNTFCHSNAALTIGGANLPGDARYTRCDPHDILLVDGTNLICHFGKEHPRFDIFVTALSYVVQQSSDLLCIFDANTYFTLRDFDSEQTASLYEEMLSQCPSYCLQVTGGSTADEVLLPEAEAREAVILSDDTFKQYRETYPWVRARNCVMRYNVVRDHIHLAATRLPLTRDVQRSVTAIVTSLKQRTESARVESVAS